MDYPFFSGLWAEVTFSFGAHPIKIIAGVATTLGGVIYLAYMVGVRIGKLLEWKEKIDTALPEISKKINELTIKVDGLSFQANSKLIQGMSPMTLTREGKILADKIPASLIDDIVHITPNLFFGEGRLDTLREIGKINDFLLSMSDSKAKGLLVEKINPAFAKICNEEGQHITSLCLVAAFRVHEQVLKYRNTPTQSPPSQA